MALFKKDKDKKHKGENIIGKIIYGFLLFAPLMSILFTSLYTTFNKNAYQSYYGNTINEIQYNYLTDYPTIKADEKYYSSSATANWTTSDNNVYVTNFEVTNKGTIDQATLTNIENNKNNILRLYISLSGGNVNEKRFTLYVFTNNTWTYLLALNPNSVIYEFSFNIDHFLNDVSKTNLASSIYYKEYLEYSYLDNSWDYGAYKTEQSSLYNWAKTTGTYTVLETTCEGLGITNTFIPMIMAYWLIISIIYFLFDISLILVWAVHDKIHELKDSI